MDSPILEHIFVGFPNLDTMIRGVEPGSAYVLLTEEHTSGDGPIGHNSYWLTVQIIAGEGVRYWRIRTDMIQVLYDRSFGPRTREDAFARSHSAEHIVCQRLTAAGWQIMEATIAFPKNLKLLNGSYNFMRYDETADRFVVVEPEA